jgi:hypothetical protein
VVNRRGEVLLALGLLSLNFDLKVMAEAGELFISSSSQSCMFCQERLFHMPDEDFMSCSKVSLKLTVHGL